MSYQASYRRINDLEVVPIDPEHEHDSCSTVNPDAETVHNAIFGRFHLLAKSSPFRQDVRPTIDVVNPTCDAIDFMEQTLLDAVVTVHDESNIAAYGDAPRKVLDQIPIYFPKDRADGDWPYGREVTRAMLASLTQLVCHNFKRHMSRGFSAQGCANIMGPVAMWKSQIARTLFDTRIPNEERNEEALRDYFIAHAEGDASVPRPEILVWRPTKEQWRKANRKVELSHREGHIKRVGDPAPQPAAEPQPQADEGNGDSVGAHEHSH